MGVLDTPCDAPSSQGHQGASWGASDTSHDTPVLFFGNVVKILSL